MESAIDVFDLDLTDLIVLTEAATGYYSLTPMIAALAGARMVHCVAANSRFGSKKDAACGVMALAEDWGVSSNVGILNSRTDDAVSEADIVTNLGFVRPLDEPFLRLLKPTAVIPLMWETWEFRGSDLDLEECRRRGIPVMGTNEDHASLQTSTYVGVVALKLLLSIDIEVIGSRVAIMGDGKFADQVEAQLSQAGAGVVRLSPAEGSKLAAPSVSDVLAGCDALVVVEHAYRGLLIGGEGLLEPQQLQAANPALSVAHICGAVDKSSLVDLGFECVPEVFCPAGHMSLTTDYVGPRPLIDLHTAGLKVGELLARARLAGLDARQSETRVLEQTPLAQWFSLIASADAVRE